MTLLPFTESEAPARVRITGDTVTRVGADKLPVINGVRYLRASSCAVALLGSRETLQWWQRGRDAVGFAKSRELLDEVMACDESPAGKRRLRRLTTRAGHLGGDRDAAAYGTRFHALVELVDAGRPAPAGLDRDVLRSLDAYQRARDWLGWITAHAEEFVACPTHRLNPADHRIVVGGIAGSADQYGAIDPDAPGAPEWAPGASGLVVGDIKTGTHDPAEYPGLGFAMQLGAYSRGRMVWSDGTLTPIPDVRRDVGVIWWCPRGAGTCHPRFVDLSGFDRHVNLLREVLAVQEDTSFIRETK